MNKVRKAVIPVAGYGTRFLPYTKAVPKAMLPILNKPAIQVICEEVVNSGITEILFVVGYKSEVIKEHFSASKELDKVLQSRGKEEFYKSIKYPEKMAQISYAVQVEVNGTAKAIEVAKEFANGEPFAILFGDDVMYNDDVPVIKQLINAYENSGKTILGCKNVEKELVPMYASVLYDSFDGNLYNATKIVEKPKLEDVVSTVSPLGRYVVAPEIFNEIDKITPSPNGEYQLTDAFDSLAKQGKVQALVFDGVRYDMGSKLGYLKANIEFALRDDELKTPLLNYLKDLIK